MAGSNDRMVKDKMEHPEYLDQMLALGDEYK